jgi:hypothetical protein
MHGTGVGSCSRHQARSHWLYVFRPIRQHHRCGVRYPHVLRHHHGPPEEPPTHRPILLTLTVIAADEMKATNVVSMPGGEARDIASYWNDT